MTGHRGPIQKRNSGTGTSRAQSIEKRVSSEERRQRIWLIAQRMAELRWNSEARQELAAEYELSIDTINAMAQEAANILELTTSPDHRERLIRLADHRLTSIALEDGKDRVPALRTILERAGALKQQVEVTQGNKTEQQFWSELRSWLLSPTRELVELLEECGWKRIGQVRDTTGEER